MAGTSKGDFYEAMNAAGVWKLPSVYVVVNNQWAISVPRSAQSGAKTLAQKGVACGVPGIQVDGNDVIAVRWAMEQGLKRARAGKGPMLIEALTYRISDHTTADDATRYRPSDEVEEAKAKEPLIRLKNYLTEIKAWNDEREEELRAEAKEEVDKEVEAYLNTEPQPISAMFEYLYAEMPEDLAAQCAAAEEEHANG